MGCDQGFRATQHGQLVAFHIDLEEPHRAGRFVVQAADFHRIFDEMLADGLVMEAPPTMVEASAAAEQAPPKAFFLEHPHPEGGGVRRVRKGGLVQGDFPPRPAQIKIIVRVGLVGMDMGGVFFQPKGEIPLVGAHVDRRFFRVHQKFEQLQFPVAGKHPAISAQFEIQRQQPRHPQRNLLDPIAHRSPRCSKKSSVQPHAFHSPPGPPHPGCTLPQSPGGLFSARPFSPPAIGKPAPPLALFPSRVGQ